MASTGPAVMIGARLTSQLHSAHPLLISATRHRAKSLAPRPPRLRLSLPAASGAATGERRATQPWATARASSTTLPALPPPTPATTAVGLPAIYREALAARKPATYRK